jgi:sensor c-di-GMP phosphodiesterase-like protein
MAKLTSIFVSARGLRIVGGLVWLVTFLAGGAILAAAVLVQIGDAARKDVLRGLSHFEQIVANVEAAFLALDKGVTATPCSAEFHEQLRRVAFLPDGLNEFFHAPGGVVHCSVTMPRFETPIDLGQPDFARSQSEETRFFVDRDIGFAGFEGMTGTIVQRGSFAIVVPPERFRLDLPPWLHSQAVLVAPDGRRWHRGGTPSIHGGSDVSGLGLHWESGAGPIVRHAACGHDGLYCIMTRAAIGDIAAHNRVLVLLILVFASLAASWFTHVSLSLIRRHWSLEARFLRHLDATSLICAYQPIVEASTGRIVGCEVLARWRDVDDSTVYPDTFLPIVQKHGLMKRMTGLLVERTARELDNWLPARTQLQVNVNIFPCELEAAELEATFRPLRAFDGRFTVALEVIESDSIPLEQAHYEIEALRRAGFRIYIDDFGTGYSTMKNVAALAVDGVKLDKSFAMAPTGSVMSEMLGHAICMIHSAGRKIVVEGVETRARLEQLREMPDRVDYLQGYFISWPLDIEGFADFLRRWDEDAVEATKRAA